MPWSVDSTNSPCSDEAALEMAYADLIATFTHDCNIVITGAPVTLTIDDQGVDPRTIHAINAGQTLRIRATTMGIYSYLHISGGIATEPVFQSRSTSPREVIGGLEGRYLRDGDTLPIGPTQSHRSEMTPYSSCPARIDAHTEICARTARRLLSYCRRRTAGDRILGHAQR